MTKVFLGIFLLLTFFAQFFLFQKQLHKFALINIVGMCKSFTPTQF